jgi:hypothetical protein
MAASTWEHFSITPDPRADRNKRHKLEAILVITLCAVIRGAETWVDIVDSARAKDPWLRTSLKSEIRGQPRMAVRQAAWCPAFHWARVIRSDG